jgi:hypothetical protein
VFGMLEIIRASLGNLSLLKVKVQYIVDVDPHWVPRDRGANY